MGLGLLVWSAALIIWWRNRACRDQTLVRVGVALLTAAGLLALELMRRGNLAEMRWALVAHAVTGGLAVAVSVPLVQRLARAAGSAVTRRFGFAYTAAAVALVLLPLTASLWSAAPPIPRGGS